MRAGKGNIEAETNVVTFMTDEARLLVNRLEVGKNGTTAYERVKGKTATVLGLGFGEKLFFNLAGRLCEFCEALL